MLFRKIDAVILLVSDMERSIDFYKNKLGLPMKMSSPDWTEFFMQGTKLALHPMKKALKERLDSRIGMLIGFMVSDLDSVCDEMKKKGVKFLKEPKKENFGKHAIIQDPDGYMISIVQLTEKVTDIDLLGYIGIE